ncbi:hypothetical protein BDV12DRAFT_193675 [Aspergillus spectabilis]
MNEIEHPDSPPSSPQSPQSPESPSNGLPTIALAQQMLQHSGHTEAEQLNQQLAETLIRPSSTESQAQSEQERDIFQRIHEQEERVRRALQRLRGIDKQIEAARSRAATLQAQINAYQQQRRRQQQPQQSRRQQLRWSRRRYPEPHLTPQQHFTRLLARWQPYLRRARITYPHKKCPDFRSWRRNFSRKITPFVNAATLQTHPDFPTSLVTFNLLSSKQLDSLALHFDQVYPPRRYSFWYDEPIKPWLLVNNGVRDLGVNTEVKRMRFGRFIGLGGCESPVYEFSGEMNVRERIIEVVERKWEKKLKDAKEGREGEEWKTAIEDGLEIFEREDARVEGRLEEREREREMQRERERENAKRLTAALVEWEKEKEANRKRVRDDLGGERKRRRRG